MAKDMDYLHIRAWGALMGSYPYYVNDQIDLARQDQAPQDVIYVVHQYDGGRTNQDVSDPQRYFRAASGRIWSRYGDPEPFGDIPRDTVLQMSRYLDSVRRTGSVHNWS